MFPLQCLRRLSLVSAQLLAPFSIQGAQVGLKTLYSAFIIFTLIDLVAVLDEVTAGIFLRSLREKMLLNETGRNILRDRPRISSKSLPLDELRGRSENTVRKVYTKWLDDYHISPNGRDHVRYIDNKECVYVIQRYRECHNLYHTIFDIPAFVEGEIALKAFEFANTGLPIATLSMLATVKLKPEERHRFANIYLPWALSNG